MMRAFMTRDADYDGVFFTAVSTTGIFCRPTCPARKPRPENVAFFADARAALSAGYRPCRRCRPTALAGAPPPELAALLAALDRDPTQRITDDALRARGIHPDRARRWFLEHHGVTFHAYARSRRLGAALGALQRGASVARVAFDHGYDSLSAFNEAFRKELGGAPRTQRERPVVCLRRVPTPLGAMLAGATETGLVLLEFDDRRGLEGQLGALVRRVGCAFVPGQNALLSRLEVELERYFDGDPTPFSVPLELSGSPFQRTVWTALGQIGRGQTTSYGELARRIGVPRAVRAVARANGHNRIAILVPCHRVIGKDGALTGYGGGLWRKQRLLELEAAAP